MKQMSELNWKEDEIEIWFENPSDDREIRYKNKIEEKYQSYGLGSNTYNIEKKLRKDMKEQNWKEPKKEKKKYKKFDLISGYEDGVQWRVRVIIHSDGNIGYSIEF